MHGVSLLHGHRPGILLPMYKTKNHCQKLNSTLIHQWDKEGSRSSIASFPGSGNTDY